MKKRKHVGDENDKKRKRIKVDLSKSHKEKFVQPHLPKTAEDISANWKALSVVLAKNKKQEKRPGKTTLPPNARRKKSMKHKNESKHNHIADTAISKSKSNEEIWFDDVDPEDILRASGSELQLQKMKEKPTASEIDTGEQHLKLITGGYEGISKYIAMDCEMVGVGINGQEHMLARVSVVNTHGRVIYDKYVAPQERVVDYRTPISGIRPAHLKDAPDFKSVQQEVFDILKDKILVGHAIKNDLKVLFLDHPHKNIRDTSKYKPFQKAVKSKKPSLKKLAKVILGMDIQSGEHCSVQDAQVTMRLYCMHKKDWERNLKENKMRGKKEKMSTSHPFVSSTTKDHETEHT